MSATTDAVRAHYSPTNLTDRIKAALASVADESQPLSVEQLAALDQFHTRGVLATVELAAAAGLETTTRVLDLGCGVGGPARYVAATFGCRVAGIDLSESFVEAAGYLTRRAGLSDKVSFAVGDALNLPFKPGDFDAVLLQHVAMNIEDRARLYAEIRRVLSPGGRMACYDIVHASGEVIYPTPWARQPATSFLLGEADTRRKLEDAGFVARLWRDDTPTAREWFKAANAAPTAGALDLGVVMGPEFSVAAANLARNLREGRVGVLSAVLTAEK